jgi:non-specific serine/threonine protein kinase
MAPQASQASRVPRVESERHCNCHAHPSLQARRQSTLPHELSSFVGRGAQLDEVATRLHSDRLVTLVGGGGIGKTRLALQVARGLHSEAPCAWTALSATMDEASVVKAVATSVCGAEQPAPNSIDALLATIGDQQLLLVVDNCEQVIAALADLVLRLLQACPRVRVLATSREPLGVPGEVVYPVLPLAVTGHDGADAALPTEAVQLFFERGQARDPRLHPTSEARALAVRICTACNGVPLAIELAAACTSSMTLAEIAARLDDMLGLLRLGSRAAPPRQRSVRASIDWSYRLLDTSEQLLLRRLALFDADFTLSAAEAVCAFEGLQTSEIAYVLDRLVAQSLLHAAKDDATTSFCLWLPVRQFAHEQLEQAGETSRLQVRMAEWSEGGSAVLMTAGAAPAAVASELVIGRRRPAPTKLRGRRAGVLSEREHDVVQLIAGGRSNREIADELVITKKTAEAHVSHILTKLGLCSRVQIATWSLQNSANVASAAAR